MVHDHWTKQQAFVSNVLATTPVVAKYGRLFLM
jgi:hypothetical protein